MKTTYDNKLREVISEKFDFLEIMPVAFCILDLEEEVLVKSNSLFSEMTKIKQNEIYDIDDIIAFIDYNIWDIKSKESRQSNFFVFLKSIDGGLVGTSANCFKYNIDGRDFLLCSFVNVLKKILPENGRINISETYSKGINSIETIKNIFEGMPSFVAVISFNRKDLFYANATCKRFFSSEIQLSRLVDMLYDLEDLDVLNNKPYFHTEFEAIIGSKWFQVSATYTYWNDKKAIVLMGKDITKMKKIEDKLLSKATTDALTKIYNRQAGVDYLSDALHEKDRKTFTIVYIDINNIKHVSSNFGLNEGDNYIINIVSIIKSAIRNTDIFARMHGGEFVVIFPNCVSEIVENIMGTIVNKIEFVNAQEQSYKYSMDYGIIQINPSDVIEVDEVLKLTAEKMRIPK